MTDQTPWTPRYASRMSRMQASEIRELLKVIERPGVISFAGGIPDPALFPKEEMAEIYGDILRTSGDAALQYSVSDGDPELKAWIARHMTAKGAPCAPENILVTSGSQQALEFLGRVFISPGDTVLAEAPTYLGALQAFAGAEPRYEATPRAPTNRSADSCRDAARDAGGDLAFIYTVPDFANPTGETLPRARRRDLIDLATAAETLIVEDSPYAELRFEGEEQPSLLALDVAEVGDIDQSRVIHCGSFSKIFAPGLRIGWVAARRDVIERLVLVKQASDLNTPRLNQLAMARLAAERYEEQAARARARYRPKRDAMLAALARRMPAGAAWTRPEGGMFIWATLPETIDAASLLSEAVERDGVAFVPGGAFHHDGSGRNTMRLSYSLPGVEAIEEGVARLAAALERRLRAAS